MIPTLNFFLIFEAGPSWCFCFKYHSDDSISVYLEQLRGRVRMELEHTFKCNIILGIGSQQERLQGIHVSYLEAEKINILIDSPFKTELYMKLTWMSKRLFFSTGIRFLNFSKSAAPICVTILCKSLLLHYSPSTGSPPRMASIC